MDICGFDGMIVYLCVCSQYVSLSACVVCVCVCVCVCSRVCVSAFVPFVQHPMSAISDLRARWRAAVTKRSLCVCENDDDLRARWRAAVTGNS